MKCKVFQLGTTHYQDVDRLQKKILERIFKNGHPDALILFESEPVITVGRSSQEGDLKEPLIQKEAIELIRVDRGGKATYHGPGQVVCFAVFDLAHIKKDIKFYLDCLEKVIIEFLKNYNIEGRKDDNNRGIWVEGRKIASVGIGIRRWVSFHGISININVDLKPFHLIKPCGISPAKMISLSKIFKKNICMEEAFKFTIEAFKDVFNLKFV